MKTVSHKELVATVAAKLQRQPADIDKLLGALVQVIERSAAEGEDVCVPAFGNFETRVIDERVIVQNGHRYLYPPRAVLKFNVSSLLARQVRFHPVNKS